MCVLQSAGGSRELICFGVCTSALHYSQEAFPSSPAPFGQSFKSINNITVNIISIMDKSFYTYTNILYMYKYVYSGSEYDVNTVKYF